MGEHNGLEDIKLGLNFIELKRLVKNLFDNPTDEDLYKKILALINSPLVEEEAVNKHYELLTYDKNELQGYKLWALLPSLSLKRMENL